MSALVAGLLGLSGEVHSQSLANTSVSATATFNGQTVYSSSGNTVFFSHGDNLLIYGDAATGRLAMEADSYAVTGDMADEVTYRATFSNTASVAQAYVFNFVLNSGAVSQVASSVQAGAGSGKLSANVRLDGVDAFATSAECAGRHCNYTGTNIGYVETLNSIGDEYKFADYAGSVSLGVLQPGQSVQIEYDLSLAGKTLGVGVGEATVGPYSDFRNNDFSNLGGVSVTAVPEPATATSMLFGLCLLAPMARRRRKTR